MTNLSRSLDQANLLADRLAFYEVPGADPGTVLRLWVTSLSGVRRISPKDTNASAGKKEVWQ